MKYPGHGYVANLEEFTDAEAALARITAIYDQSVSAIRDTFAAFVQRGEVPAEPLRTNYPYLGIDIATADLDVDRPIAYGALFDPGVYGTTLTRPDLFAAYYREQIALLLDHHRVPVVRYGLEQRCGVGPIWRARQPIRIQQRSS